MAGLLDDDGLMASLYLLAAGSAKPQRTSVGEGLLGMGQFLQQRQQGREDRAAREEERKQRGLFQNMQMKQMQGSLDQQQMQAEQLKRQQEQEAQFRALIQSPQGAASSAALAGGGGPTVANAQRMQPVDPLQQMQFEAMRLGQIKPLDYINAQNKGSAPLTVPPGAALVDPKTFKPVFSNPKEDSLTGDVKNYQYAQSQGYKGTFQQFQTELKRAGATNIGMPKIEVKMGDSVAGQVGPMVKDSKVQAGGAIKMFDAADRIEKALDSKLVTTGPLASKIQTVKQFVQVVAGGNDAGIRQTQQVIRSLAQMSVEARKQLQGQGQVTETEAAAVAKADAGDIDNLTTGELRDLVALTKRASHFTAKGHAELVRNMESNEGTRGAAPFYRVQGLEPLLRHAPMLPQIGGAPSVDDLVNKYDKPVGN